MDERLLIRAAGPGRMRGIGLALWEAAAARPADAGRLFAEGLRNARVLHSAERRFVQEVLYGLVRSARGLAEVVGADDPLALWLARLVLDGLPAHIAAEHLPFAWDTIPGRWERFDAHLGTVDRLVFRHNWSEAVATRVVAVLGEQALAYAASSDARAPIDLRANPRRCTPEALAARLMTEGVPTRPLGVPGGLRVDGRHHLLGLPSFREGWFEVQDEGSQKVAALVDPRGLVIDVCAGAGGKSLAFAGRGARVLALDVRPRALIELERRAERAGVSIATRRIRLDRLPDDLPLAERVVVDAPCSGTGVLRRHPEHRFVDDSALARHAEVQRRLLVDAARFVAPDGVLVYATCSVLPDENDAVVATLTNWEPAEVLRTWTHRDGCDGFFAAVLRRK